MRVVLAVLLCATALLASPQERDRLRSAFSEAVEEQDSERAQRIAERMIESEPMNPHACFALVRALAMGGRTEEAADALRVALERGFVDLHRLVDDPVFAPLREHELCVWLFDHWIERLDTRGRLEAASLLAALGEGYRIHELPDLRVRVVSAPDEDLIEMATVELRHVEAFARRLFPEATDERPDPWVMVILPQSEDAELLLPASNVAGVYDHERKGLVVRDIGPALRHEFFHALHWRHMERIGQRHPVWIREGLATLVEDVDVRGGRIEIIPSWRTNAARRLARVGRLRPWSSLAALTPERFVSTRALLHYAQARALFHWLYDTSLLGTLYEAYTARYDQDPLGVDAIGVVTGQEQRDWTRAHRAWLMEQEEVGEPDAQHAIGLGVRLREGAGDGPVVDEFGFVSEDEIHLRPRDIIREVGGVPVRTLRELYREMGRRSEGDRVTAVIDRAGETLRVTLRVTIEERLPWH